LRSGEILLVGDRLQPVHGLAVELFLNGDVRHRRGRRGTVPVLLAGRYPDYVAWTDFLNWSALALNASAAGGDDKRLAQRMGVPGRARTRLEGDVRADDARRIGRVEQRVDADSAGEICEPLREGCEPALLMSMTVAFQKGVSRGQAFSEAMSITKRYFTSLFSRRS